MTEPEVLQSELFGLAWRILGKSPANFSANLMANFFCECFGLVFHKIHAQNSRPKSSAFLYNFTFSNPIFFFFTPIFCLIWGRPRMILVVLRGSPQPALDLI